MRRLLDDGYTIEVGDRLFHRFETGERVIEGEVELEIVEDGYFMRAPVFTSGRQKQAPSHRWLFLTDEDAFATVVDLFLTGSGEPRNGTYEVLVAPDIQKYSLPSPAMG